MGKEVTRPIKIRESVFGMVEKLSEATGLSLTVIASLLLERAATAAFRDGFNLLEPGERSLEPEPGELAVSLEDTAQAKIAEGRAAYDVWLGALTAKERDALKYSIKRHRVELNRRETHDRLTAAAKVGGDIDDLPEELKARAEEMNGTLNALKAARKK